MNDELKKGLDEAATAGVELSDEDLEGVAGGVIYHDPGNAAAHRREAYYVLDDAGQVVMRFDNQAKAEHWAANLRTSPTLISAEEFERLRRKNG